MTAVTDGAGHGRRGRSAGPPPHGGCPYRFGTKEEQFPRWDVVETKCNLLEFYFEKIVVHIK